MASRMANAQRRKAARTALAALATAVAATDEYGRAWLVDLAARTGLSTVDVAECARAQGLRLERCDLPALYAKASASAVAYTGGVWFHYVRP